MRTTRYVIAAVAVGVIGAVAFVAVAGASRRRSRPRAQWSRVVVRRTADRPVDQQLQGRVDRLQPGRLRGGDHRDPEPHRRLRRLRRADDRRPVHELPRLRHAAVGAVRIGHPLQPAGRQEQHPPDRHRHRRDVPREDLEVERPEDQEAEPGRQPARHRHHAGLPQRTAPARRSTSPTSCRPRARRSATRSATTRPSTGRRASGRAVARASPAVLTRTPGCGRLRRHRVRAREQAPVRRRPEQASGKWALPGIRGIKAAALADKKFDSRNFLSIVNPPKGKKYEQRLPDLHLHVRDPADCSRRRPPTLKAFVNWAITRGQPLRRQAPVRPDPVLRASRATRQVLKRVSAS